MNNKLMQTHATDMILISKIFEALQKLVAAPSEAGQQWRIIRCDVQIHRTIVSVEHEW